MLCPSFHHNTPEWRRTHDVLDLDHLLWSLVGISNASSLDFIFTLKQEAPKYRFGQRKTGQQRRPSARYQRVEIKMEVRWLWRRFQPLGCSVCGVTVGPVWL